MNRTVIIPGRFNGPPDSGNGGYSCGVLAAFIDGPTRVRLHGPPPLDHELSVRPEENGAVAMFDGDYRVATAFPTTFDLDIPPAPGLTAAVDAATRYACYENHVFPTCFVCGPGRPDHDGLEIYAGPDQQGTVFASPFRPAADLLDANGMLRPEICWAALDCPGYFACMGSDVRPAVLGELQADLLHPVPGGQPLVAFAWSLGAEGRKLHAGSALADRRGRLLARAYATWILLRT
jgi:hypothetical protein